MERQKPRAVARSLCIQTRKRDATRRFILDAASNSLEGGDNSLNPVEKSPTIPTRSDLKHIVPAPLLLSWKQYTRIAKTDVFCILERWTLSVSQAGLLMIVEVTVDYGPRIKSQSIPLLDYLPLNIRRAQSHMPYYNEKSLLWILLVPDKYCYYHSILISTIVFIW